jgi:HEAT repeat protein
VNTTRGVAGVALVMGSIVFGGIPGADVAQAGAQRTPSVPPYEDVLKDLGNDIDPEKRVDAMRTLARGGHPDGIALVARLLTDPVDAIQIEAIDTLLAFHLEDLPRLTKRIGGILEVSAGSRAQQAFDVGPFVLLPREVPDTLRLGLAGAMRDDQTEVRREATWTLGALVPPPAGREAETALGANLRHPDHGVRLASARAAGAVRATTIGNELIAAINDREQDVSLAAMRSLGDIREVRGIPALWEQLEYFQTGPKARAALDGLARIAEPSTLPIFQERIASKDPEVRRLALEGIARIGDRRALLAAERSTADERNRTVQLARAFALERAGRPGLEDLVRGLHDDDHSYQCMGYLVELGQAVVPRLIGGLKSPDPRIRQRLVQVIGFVGGPEARQTLEPTTRDPDPDVARAADWAMARTRLSGL